MKVKQYVTLPVIKEAIRFIDTAECIMAIAEWSNCGLPIERPLTLDKDIDEYPIELIVSYRARPCYLIIQTLEGEMTCNEGDWIIKGVKGEFYPCKDEVFKMTYKELKNE